MLHAFELARDKVAERGKPARFEPSAPQLWTPPAVLRWKELRASQAKRALENASLKKDE